MGMNSRKWQYYNWTRYELRLTETLNTDQWTTVHRVRNQTRLSIPLASPARAWTPKTAVLFSDIEPIYRSDKGNIDPLRLRVGLGYIASPQCSSSSSTSRSGPARAGAASSTPIISGA